MVENLKALIIGIGIIMLLIFSVAFYYIALFAIVIIVSIALGKAIAMARTEYLNSNEK